MIQWRGEELGMEFDILRLNMERRASSKEDLPRLQQRRLQTQRAEALLLRWQNRERSVLSLKLVRDLPASHQLNSFDPESVANRTHVAQQAHLLAIAARRRARSRLFASASAASDADLDPITGVIQRASLTGGRMHACDLASLSARGTERDGESNPDKWLLGILTAREAAEPWASPAVQGRLSRAREARRSSEEEDADRLWGTPNTPRDVRSPRSGAAPDSAPATKPRSLAEIRSAGRGLAA